MDFHSTGDDRHENPYAAGADPGAYEGPPMSAGSGGNTLWLGLTSLLCGLGSLLGFCCFLLWVCIPVGLIAGGFSFYLGFRELKAVDQGWSHPSNRGQAQIGMVLGGCGLFLCLASGMLIVAGAVWFGLMLPHQL